MTDGGEPGRGVSAARRLWLWAPVALMMGLQLFLSSQSHLPAVLPAFQGVDKLEHVVWFFILGSLAVRAGWEAEGWSRQRMAILLLAGALFWGITDEFHQSFVPGRAVEAGDVAADVAGAALAALLAEPLLRRLGFLTPR